MIVLYITRVNPRIPFIWLSYVFFFIIMIFIIILILIKATVIYFKQIIILHLPIYIIVNIFYSFVKFQ